MIQPPHPSETPLKEHSSAAEGCETGQPHSTSQHIAALPTQMFVYDDE